MASRKSFLSKPSYILPSTTTPETHFDPKSSEGGSVLEFDEADLWNMSISNNTNKKALSSSSRSALKRGSSRKADHAAPAATSLPVNIPDWSKILKEEYKEHPKWESDDDDDDDDDDGDGDGDGDHEEDGDHHHGGIRLPPHEYLARTRGASLSVHEGIGRTLKGRDLRSVRNAIWKKVGFED